MHLHSRRSGLRATLVRLLAVAACVLPGARAEASDAPLRVCATTPDLGALVREAGGERVIVTVFAKGTEDPHSLEARPSWVRALSEADLFVRNGLGLDTAYADLLARQARNPRILPGGEGFLDASTALERPLEVPVGTVDRSMGDVHPGGNPHYLLDPLRGLAVARLIAARLAELDPASKPIFDERLADFTRRLYAALVGPRLAAKDGADVPKLVLLYRHGKLASSLDEQRERDALGGWLGAMLEHRGAKAVDDHPIWPYFAETFGLEIVAHLEPMPGVPPSTRHLEQVIETMRAQQVRIVLASAYDDRRYARLVGESTGARVLAMANQVDAVPEAKTYLEMIDYDVRQVAGALAGAKSSQGGARSGS